MTSDDDATAMSAPMVDESDLAAVIGVGPGSQIGPYRLLQLIGEGGFGSVFLAEEQGPVVRTVALKVIKFGMDTKQVVARFEQERQALALMDHPNIAKVLNAGATETGRPYFVMELCKGDRIVEYCDKHNLAIDERLALFIQVCNAVQHAHTKGIIHRDLKPSNILVSAQDGKPSAKVIDFGIAKATAAKLTERTLFTEQSAMIGTPEYMSPEQADGSLDIDTRTDVYSLGVLLYELLTGSTPFTVKDLRSANHAELQRIIREVAPPKPSTRISASGAALADVAARRRSEPKRLGTVVRGELDWIVMKAIEKDRQRRYETANGLAMDVARYLAGEAVLAAPPSAAYRLRTFVRRHRLQVAAAAAVAIALLVSMAGVVWQAKVASDNADAARLAEDAANLARDAERARADELELVSNFQARMLSQIDATAAGARLTDDVEARLAAALAKSGLTEAEQAARASAFREGWRMVNATDAASTLIDETILTPAVRAIDEQFTEQPAIDAQLRHALGELYHTLGRYERSLQLQQAALATRRRVFGDDHPSTLLSMHDVGVLLKLLGRFSEAEPFVREALEKRRRLLGDDHPHTLITMHVMGGLLLDLGVFDEAERLTREVAERGRRVLGDAHPNTMIYTNSLGALLASRGKMTEAEPYLTDGLAMSRRVLGEDHPSTLKAIYNIAALLHNNRKAAQAEPYYREALERYRRVRGENHPETLLAVRSMGAVLRALDRPDEAEPYLREALEKSRLVLGEEHPETISCERSLAVLFASKGEFAEAEQIFRSVLARSRRALGDDHQSTLGGLNNMGAILASQRRWSDAEPFCREALERHRRVLGDDHASTLEAMGRMVSVLREVGKLAEAEPIARAAVEGYRRVHGDRHPLTLVAIADQARVVLGLGRHQEALDLLVPIESAARSAITARNAAKLATLLTTLARANMGLGFEPERFRRSEALLLEAHAMFLASPDRGPEHPETRWCAQSLVELYEAWHVAAPGESYGDQATRWRRSASPQ